MVLVIQEKRWSGFWHARESYVENAANAIRPAWLFQPHPHIQAMAVPVAFDLRLVRFVRRRAVCDRVGLKRKIASGQRAGREQIGLSCSS